MSDGCNVQFVDSHTEGEPTRLVIAGGPDLGAGTLAERASQFAQQFDRFRQQVILEPRGSDILVGALLCEPDDPECDAGVIFFNNTGYLGMCGHGAIGVVATLSYLDRLNSNVCKLQTPVGSVTAELGEAGEVKIQNVESYRLHKDIAIDVEGFGKVNGDVAWGGNWFFLTKQSHVSVTASNIEELTSYAWRIRRALEWQGIAGEDNGVIDHIEVFGQPSPGANGKSFVLCPGGAYDRSPCGTGTSAKLACLAAEGELAPGEVWIQESVIGSRFSGSYQLAENGRIIPSITGRAFITGRGELIGQIEDPFRYGIDVGATT